MFIRSHDNRLAQIITLTIYKTNFLYKKFSDLVVCNSVDFQFLSVVQRNSCSTS